MAKEKDTMDKESYRKTLASAIALELKDIRVAYPKYSVVMFNSPNSNITGKCHIGEDGYILAFNEAKIIGNLGPYIQITIPAIVYKMLQMEMERDIKEHGIFE